MTDSFIYASAIIQQHSEKLLKLHEFVIVKQKIQIHPAFKLRIPIRQIGVLADLGKQSV